MQRDEQALHERGDPDGQSAYKKLLHFISHQDKANQKYNESITYPLEWLFQENSKQGDSNKDWEDMEQLELIACC